MYCSYHIVPLYCSLVLMKASLCVGFLAFETFTFPHTILVSQDVSELAHKLHIDQQIALLEKNGCADFLVQCLHFIVPKCQYILHMYFWYSPCTCWSHVGPFY